MADEKLYVREIFTSIDGEVNAFGQGRLVTFLRLAGCNLRCPYCDTPDTWDEEDGMLLELSDVEKYIHDKESLTGKNLTITGGEPLIQIESLIPLIERLLFDGWNISVETNGTKNIPAGLIQKIEASGFKGKLRWVVDIKLGQKVFFPLFDLCEEDYLKIVINDRPDFLEAVQIVDILNHEERKYRPMKARIAFSPNLSKVKADTLIEWMMTMDIKVMLNLQIHKLIGVQ